MSVGQFGTGQSTRPGRLPWAPLTLPILRGLTSGGFQAYVNHYGLSPDGGICQSFSRRRVGGIPAADLETGERALLEDNRERMMRLPFSPIDILIVEEMGKNVSGSGLDTNVIVRLTNPFEPLK